MKPHLRRFYGIWSCFTREPRAMGHGYTPREAYDEWVLAVLKGSAA